MIVNLYSNGSIISWFFWGGGGWIAINMISNDNTTKLFAVVSNLCTILNIFILQIFLKLLRWTPDFDLDLSFINTLKLACYEYIFLLFFFY